MNWQQPMIDFSWVEDLPFTTRGTLVQFPHLPPVRAGKTVITLHFIRNLIMNQII